MSKILILGIGNPLLADDGAGIRVVEEIRKRNLAGIVAKEYTSDFDLLEALNGDYSRIIIVDAVKTGAKPGTVYRTFLDDSPPEFSSHHIDLSLIKKCNKEIILLAIEAGDIENLSEKCTPEVERAISEVLNIIKNFLEKVIS